MKSLYPIATLLAVLAASPLAAGPSAEVNAEAFYATAMEIKAKGVLAAFDKRTKPMQAQMVDAGKSARAANAAATKRGSPLYCVPASARKQGLDVDKALAMLGAVGRPVRQNLSLEKAWLRALHNEYPC